MSRIEAKEPPSTASEYQWMIRSIALRSTTSSTAEVTVAAASIIRGLRGCQSPNRVRPGQVRARSTRRASGLMNAAMPSSTPANHPRGRSGGVPKKMTIAHTASARANRVESGAEGEEDERGDEYRDQPPPEAGENEESDAESSDPCGVEQEHDDHEEGDVVGEQLKQVDQASFQRSQGRRSAVCASEHFGVGVTEERRGQGSCAHPRRGGRLFVSRAQARTLQSQGEEGGDTEDRSQHRGLGAAEPAAGGTEVNADRTAEQWLGDPGAGLRGHDSRLPVSR
jgi:hypothetical protein